MSVIVVCGLPKTGTSSMRDALNILGYRHGRIDEIGKKVKGDVHFTGDDVNKPLDRYQKLDEIYPDAKFILTLRTDKTTWWNSIYKWARRKDKINDTFIKNQRKEMYGHSMPTEENKQDFLRVYDKKAYDTIEYFDRRYSKLLVFISGKDGWEKLCKFLNKDIPDREFPHSNKNK